MSRSSPPFADVWKSRARCVSHRSTRKLGRNPHGKPGERGSTASAERPQREMQNPIAEQKWPGGPDEAWHASSVPRIRPRRGSRGTVARVLNRPSERPAQQHARRRGGSGEAGDENTYLLDDGLRECLAHGDAVSGCNSAAARLPVGVEGLVLSFGKRNWAEE